MQIKSSLVALLATICCSASAQASEVTLYGMVDSYLQFYNVGSKSYAVLGSGGKGGSRFGIKGKEDLGAGSSVFFRLENGFFLDNGANTTAAESSGWAFQREAVLGLKSNKCGTISFGRQYTLNFVQSAMFDAFSVSLGSTLNNFMSPAPYTAAGHYPGINGLNGSRDTNNNNNLTRANNSFVYESPNLGGLIVAGMFAFGENKDADYSSTIGNLYALQMTYRSGALATGLTWTLHNLQAGGPNVPAITNRTKNNLINWGASYDFKVTKAYLNFAYKKAQHETNSNPTLWVAGGSLKTPLAGGVLLNGFHYLHNDTTDAADAWNVSARYDYPLSKRTTVYAGAAYMNNEKSVNYTINGGGGSSGAPGGDAPFGKNPWTLFLGLNHSF